MLHACIKIPCNLSSDFLFYPSIYYNPQNRRLGTNILQVFMFFFQYIVFIYQTYPIHLLLVNTNVLSGQFLSVLSIFIIISRIIFLVGRKDQDATIITLVLHESILLAYQNSQLATDYVDLLTHAFLYTKLLLRSCR